MSDILFDFPIAAPTERVFWGVSAPEGLDHWWTLRCAGHPAEGTEYVLDFGPGFLWRARVVAVDSSRVFELEMTEVQEDWRGTRVRFVLTPRGPDTLLSFSHRGWKDPTDHFRTTSYCWALYLRHLRLHLEKGISVPYDERLDA